MNISQIDWNPDVHPLLSTPTAESVATRICRALDKDVNGKIRQALIDLGWTPPPPDYKKPEAK